MKKVHLKVGYRPWSGDQQVAQAEATAMVIEGIEINGLAVYTEAAILDLDGFAAISVRRFASEDMSHEEIKRLEEEHNVLISQFTAEDWLEGTTDEILILPIASIEFVEVDPR